MTVKCRSQIWYSLVAAICLTVIVLTFSKKFLYQTLVDQQKPQGETQASVSSQFGYVFATDFSDQMTGAAINILSLQCWAGAVSERLMVAEPFVHKGSSFGVTLSDGQKAETENEVRLQDVLNIESWERQIRGRHYAPLKNWKAFLESSPKNLIVVGKTCGKKNCNDHFYGDTSLFAKKHRFNIVRSVQLKSKQLYSFSKFRDLIYGDNKPNQSVVVFHVWGGIVGKATQSRISMSGHTPCDRESLFNFLLANSPKIVEESKRYLDRYLPKVDYISVMLRMQLLLNYHNLGKTESQEQKMSLITKCVKGIVNQVRTMQKVHNTTSVFLTVDCQKYGSNIFRNTHPRYMGKDLVKRTMKILFSALKSYGLVLSLEEWETSFDEISSFQTPGYVALLQKNVAASGKCLVTAGGGSFQKSSVALYKSIHNSKMISSKCYTRVREC